MSLHKPTLLERWASWWPHAMCLLIGHDTPHERFTCYVCPRCWRVVVPPRRGP